MALSTRIDNITGKTFDELKTRHIQYISDTDQFKDFNFRGSRLNVLMSALTFSTYYMQAYANFALRESFLQTCRTLSNGVIAAQNMGYIPRGLRGAADTVELVVTDNQQRSFVTIPAGTVFSGTVAGDTYLFTVTEDQTEERLSDGTYRFTLSLKQGEQVSRFRTFGNDGQEFTVRDERIDTSSLQVFVNSTEWSYFNTSLDTTPVSNAFYYRYNEDLFPVIYFGLGTEDGSDGFGGETPAIGSNIEIRYLRTQGSEANGSRNYELVTGFNDLQVQSITDNPEDIADYTGASGGDEFETLTNIKNNAPLFKQAYRRLTTPVDYETVITNQFGNFIGSVRTTGKRESPGYAFLNIKPKQGLTLSPSIRQDIEDFVEGRNVFPVQPLVVDPDYLFVDHTINIDYDTTKFTGNLNRLRQNIINGVETYYAENVDTFGRSFHTSRLLSSVDSSSDIILGSEASIKLITEIDDDGTADTFSGSFYNNPLEDGSFITSGIPFQSDTLDNANEPVVYDVFIKAKNNGDLIIGPFLSAENISETIYETDSDGDWYEVGSIDSNTNYEFSFPLLGISRARFLPSTYTITVTPEEPDIYTDDDVIIVFDYDLRPEYLTLNLNPVIPRG